MWVVCWVVFFWSWLGWVVCCCGGVVVVVEFGCCYVGCGFGCVGCVVVGVG